MQNGYKVNVQVWYTGNVGFTQIEWIAGRPGWVSLSPWGGPVYVSYYDLSEL